MMVSHGANVVAAVAAAGSGVGTVLVVGFVELDDRATYWWVGALAGVAAVGCLTLVCGLQGLTRLIPAFGLAACLPLFQTGLLVGPDPSSMDFFGFIVLGSSLLLVGLMSLGASLSATSTRSRRASG